MKLKHEVRKKKSYIDNAISHSMLESNLEKYILFKKYIIKYRKYS